MSSREIVYAAAGAGGPVNYVDDVFSTWLYTGNGTSQTINNGIALANGVNVPPGTAMAGGYFAGLISTTANGVPTHAIIVAPKSSGETSSVRWKTSDTNTSGTSSVIDGPTNSSNMNNASHPAAQFCEGLTIGGFSDWYMPAKNELEVCYFNLKPTTGTNNTASGTNTNAVPSRGSNYLTGTPTQTTATLFQSGGAEAFGAGNYWSSTQLDSTYAWPQLFSNGNQEFDYKTLSINVRAVRRIAISDAALDPYRITGKGGMVWLKARNTTTFNCLFDTNRGGDNRLVSNTTNAQSTYVGNVTSFNSNGFSIGDNVQSNQSGFNYVSWTFRKQPKFFDVLTWTGNGSSNRQISHSLDSVPGMIIIKDLDYATNWVVMASDGAGNYYMGSTSTNQFSLNTTAAATQNVSASSADVTTTYFNAAKVQINSGSTFDETAGNSSGSRYVAYLFASNAGGFGTSGTDNVISCGSFTCNGSGFASVNLGYEPQYLLVKRTDGANNWWIADNMRGLTAPTSNYQMLQANTVSSEATATNLNINATGFTSNNGGLAGMSFIYMAIRRPMKPPTSGTQVFSPITYTGSGTNSRAFTTNFAGDLAFWSNTDKTIITDQVFINKLCGTSKRLFPTTTGPETATGTGNSIDFTNTQVVLGTTASNNYDYSGMPVVIHAFRRATKFFDVVCWGGSGASVNHNLSVAPELLIYKTRSQAGSWNIYCSALSSPLDNFLRLETTAAATNIGVPLFQNMTSTTFGLTSGIDYGATANVAYLFASVAGVSKVGSYTGTGATQTINAGFTGGARYVLIKRTDSTGDWFVWDTARGMVTSTDPRLALNSTAAELNNDWVYTTTGGFQIVTTDASVNASGGSFIYLAIA